MGGCANKDGELELDFCLMRETGSFKAPNTDYVTYYFDGRAAEDSLASLPVDFGKLTTRGILIEPKRKDVGLPSSMPHRNHGRLPAKWCTLKETLQPTHMRLCVSGRIFLKISELADETPRIRQEKEHCAFAVCTRGAMQTQSVKTETFKHEITAISSGVVFAIFVSLTKSGVFIYPRILLHLECGDDVVLVDESMGPLPPPYLFNIDFCIVDDGGRNLQLDVICRGDQDELDLNGGQDIPEKRWNLKMCLQEYSTINNHIQPSCLSIGNSSVGTHLPSASVFLQNLVVSEEPHDEHRIQASGPFDVGRYVDRLRETKQTDKILFEGGDALKIASSGCDTKAHPQIKTSPRKSPFASDDLNVADFWYHIKYEDEDDTSSLEARCYHFGKVITGEFWLSRKPLPDKKNIYFHCSSTLAQALTMCIAFRFNCTRVHMQLISEQHKDLRHEHIPTNGIIMGLEHDPRNRYLLRMFIEHRNDILDDITMCECWSSLVTQIVVHQEVFDSGTEMLYRTTLVYPDGKTQSTVLQTKVDKLEERYFDSAAHSQDHIIGDPSPRFPIAPCNLAHKMEVENRIFVYSTVPYQRDFIEDSEGWSDRGSYTSALHEMEDFQSVGGYGSDGDLDLREESTVSQALRGASGTGREMPANSVPFDVEWRCPVVQSATLLHRMDKPPFTCFPAPLP